MNKVDKVDIIKNFNSILGDFLKQVSPMVGTTYHHYFTKLIQINAVEPIRLFSYYVHNSEKPLATYIETRNEEYFENTDNHKKYMDKVTSENALMEIIKLKGIYTQLNKESKDNLWDILQALLQLSKEYLSFK
jgi:hypothetical protein